MSEDAASAVAGTPDTSAPYPDESTIRWDAALIDGVWCVGMEGNLDTGHDATLRITGGWLDGAMAEKVARAIVEQHNAAIPAPAVAKAAADATGDDIVTMKFVNRSALEYGSPEADHVLRVDRVATRAIAQWYGGYCGGDDYDVLIDGEIVEKDLNGEI